MCRACVPLWAAALRQFWVNGVRADRPRVYGTGSQPGDNRNGQCLNLTNVSSTALYPTGSAFDFGHEHATNPALWPNPADVEFVYTSCDAINCWIEPRCTVESVDGSVVRLKQDGNESCYHRLYYYAQVWTPARAIRFRPAWLNLAPWFTFATLFSPLRCD